MAADSVPAAAVNGSPEATPLRRYLPAGGRLVKSFGGPAGSGFVRLWGREDPIPDLSWVRAVAEHAE